MSAADARDDERAFRASCPEQAALLRAALDCPDAATTYRVRPGEPEAWVDPTAVVPARPGDALGAWTVLVKPVAGRHVVLVAMPGIA